MPDEHVARHHRPDDPSKAKIICPSAPPELNRSAALALLRLLLHHSQTGQSPEAPDSKES
ncbi:hypothetical protein ACFWPX_03765 [Nocardia sp. NPDC058518]|uniref:hypothetical protein n=1 Tax=Nocardia sp. NPDC058518 TaxID=3346534 RepID=UPI003666C5A2